MIKNTLPPGGQQSFFGEDAAVYFVQGGQYIFRWRDTDTNRYRSKPVSPQAVKAAFAQIETDSGWIPDGILRIGHNRDGAWFVQAVPAQRTELLIHGDDDETAEITVPLPAFVFVGCGKKYGVWAVKDQMPTPLSTLYQAPLPNVESDGSICWGQNSPGPANAATAHIAWATFIQSPFNGDLIQDKSVLDDNDIRRHLVALSKQDITEYPLADLVQCPHGITLEVITQEIVR
ncbi:MAG: hypothetical protein U9Q82_03245 [Chloroflexota bacterium]|nr:hypothetical protein [Chloroflexota bacterium]